MQEYESSEVVHTHARARLSVFSSRELDYLNEPTGRRGQAEKWIQSIPSQTHRAVTFLARKSP